jgi:hypothetical protein
MITSESRQEVMVNLGKYGCYFLSIVHIAEEITEKRIDAIVAYLDGLKQQLIEKDCTVLNPAELLFALTGDHYAVTKETAGYKTAANELEILVFKADCTHFVVGDGTGKVAYDPLGASNTVKYGVMIEKRIFRKA